MSLKDKKFTVLHKKRISESHRGLPGTWLGKHFSPEHRKTMSTNRMGKGNGGWKGDDVGYSAIHRWVRWHKGSANKCELCGKTKWVVWANIDHKYKRDVDDYMALCRSCHWHYDTNANNKADKNYLLT